MDLMAASSAAMNSDFRSGDTMKFTGQLSNMLLRASLGIGVAWSAALEPLGWISFPATKLASGLIGC